MLPGMSGTPVRMRGGVVGASTRPVGSELASFGAAEGASLSSQQRGRGMHSLCDPLSFWEDRARRVECCVAQMQEKTRRRPIGLGMEIWTAARNGLARPIVASPRLVCFFWATPLIHASGGNLGNQSVLSTHVDSTNLSNRSDAMLPDLAGC